MNKPKNSCITVPTYFDIEITEDMLKLIGFEKRENASPWDGELEGYYPDFRIVKDWLNKSMAMDRYEDRFISLWIAFNTIYRNFWYSNLCRNGRWRSDKDAVESIGEFIDKNSEGNEFISSINNIVEFLKENEFKLRKRRGREIVRESMTDEYDKSEKRVKDGISLILYTIRNNTFHGAKTRTEEQEMLFKMAYSSLSMFIKTFFSIIKQKVTNNGQEID